MNNNSKKKPKVAVIGLKGLPAFGGAATVGENIINQLYDKYDFTVYSVASHTDQKSGIYKGICNQIVLKSILLHKLNTLLYYIISALHAVIFGKYTLVHLHHRDASFIIPILKIRYPVILTTHGMELTDKWKRYKPFFDFQDKIFLSKANAITTVSLKDKRIVRSILKSKLITYIPNGIDAIRKGYLKDEYLTFAAGRIVPNKACHVLLEALQKLNYQGKVLVIGDYNQMGAYKDKLFSLAQALKGVEFLGLVKDKNKLFEIIGSSKLFIYPSEIESMSMMMLEVASLHTPMICADIPENKDVFSEDELLYFEKANSSDLADKIRWSLEHYNDMLVKSDNAIRKLKELYLWQDIAIKYDEVYKKFLR